MTTESAATSTGGSPLPDPTPYDELRRCLSERDQLSLRRQVLAVAARARTLGGLNQNQVRSFLRTRTSDLLKAQVKQNDRWARDLIREGFSHSESLATPLGRAALRARMAERLVASLMAAPADGTSVTRIVGEKAAVAAVGVRLLGRAESLGYDTVRVGAQMLAVDLGISETTAKARLRSLRERMLLVDTTTGRRGRVPKWKALRPTGHRVELMHIYSFIAEEIVAEEPTMVGAVWSAVSHPAIANGPLTHVGWLCALLRAAEVNTLALDIPEAKARAALRSWDKVLDLPGAANSEAFLQRLDAVAQESGAQAKRGQAERLRHEAAAERKAQVEAAREARRVVWAARQAERHAAKAVARPSQDPGVVVEYPAAPAERITVTLPGFDPDRHLNAIIAKVSAQKGPGWAVEAYDVASGSVTLRRPATARSERIGMRRGA